MLRRQFIAQTGLAGAVMLPSMPSIAQGLGDRGSKVQWSLLSEQVAGTCQASGPCHAGTVRVQVRPGDAVAGVRASSRLWFQGEVDAVPFELASFSANGRSQSLRFTADAERLVALECRHGPDDALDAQQLLLSQGGLGHLGLGRHWLLLHPAGIPMDDPADSRALARIRLDVTAA